jgi:Protein of unknown function (DUF3465)
MGLKAPLAFSLMLLATAGCTVATATANLDKAAAECSGERSGNHYVEVYIPRASVVRVLGIRRSYSGAHEGFIVDAQQHQIKVEDNVDITGPIPLRRGDTVSLLGQYECDDGVIHWTHRDPRGRHIAGYIEVNGQRYQ